MTKEDKPSEPNIVRCPECGSNNFLPDVTDRVWECLDCGMTRKFNGLPGGETEVNS